MNGTELLKKYIEERGLSVCEVAKLTKLSQGIVSMHLSSSKHRRGIGGKAAIAYNRTFGLPVDKLIQKDEA